MLRIFVHNSDANDDESGPPLGVVCQTSKLPLFSYESFVTGAREEDYPTYEEALCDLIDELGI